VSPLSPQDLGDFRSALKTGKRQLSRGNAKEAERYLLRALATTDYFEDQIVKNEKKAFVLHRLAEVYILEGEPINAHKCFREALKLSNAGNPMGHARLLRDYGNFERIQGHDKSGLKRVNQAIDILESQPQSRDRVKKELLVTQGFLARFYVNDPDRRESAIETWQVIARELRGYKKKAYELANLRCLIDALPFYSLERSQYIQRAVLLSFRLGNYKKAGEYAALLGGKPARSVFRFMVR